MDKKATTPAKHITSASQSSTIYKTGGKSHAPKGSPGRTTSASQSKTRYGS